MMAKIKLFAKQHGEIYIISDDDAFKSLKNNPAINVFDTLHAFFVFINPYEDWIQRVQFYVDKNRHGDKIKSSIEDKIFDNAPHDYQRGKF